MSTHSLGKSLLLVALISGMLLLVPLVAMRITNQVSWTVFDFVVAGALLFITGSAIVLVLKYVSSLFYRRFSIALIVLALATIWVELAVGIFH